MQGDTFQQQAPFCTFEECREMAASGLVHIASHSFSHCSLLGPAVDANDEIIGSKAVLEAKLNTPVESFVYPYGHFTRALQAKVQQHYRYSFRIGSACHRHWEERRGLFYRVDAERLWPQQLALSPALLRGYHRKYWLNQWRGK